MITIKDKGYGNFSVYEEIGCGLHFDIELIEKDNIIEKGKIGNWELTVGPKELSGYGIEALTNMFDIIIEKFMLKQLSVAKKKLVVIYIDNLNKIRGFFRNIITEDFTHYVQVKNYIEFRDITAWNKDLHQATEIAEYAQFLIDEVFVPNKYFYITVPQSVRRRLKEAWKTDKNSIAKDIYPEDYGKYRLMKMALFGGLCYCPYPNLIIEEPMIEIDLDSAYIFDFLIERHCMSEANEEDPNNWEYFLSSTNKTSLGKYKIHYACSTNKAHCYKNYRGENVEYGEHTDTFILTNIDLAIFMSLVTILDIECDYLISYELEYLPEYVRETIINEYVKKEALKYSGNENAYQVQKAALNSLYGSTIRNLDSIEAYKNDYKNAIICPQWGIWTTAYCKKYLLGLATKIDGWYYSDTDSIYCKDTEENRKLIEEFNANIRAKTKAFCEKFGYDYNKLKKIGTFEIKNEIKKFKAIKQKIYMYTTNDDRLILKAAGCNKREEILNDDIYYLDKIPVGERTFGFFTEDSYFEMLLKNEAAEYMTMLNIAADIIDN